MPAAKPRGAAGQPHPAPFRPPKTPPSTNAPTARPATSASNAAKTATPGVDASAQAAHAPTATGQSQYPTSSTTPHTRPDNLATTTTNNLQNSTAPNSGNLIVGDVRRARAVGTPAQTLLTISGLQLHPLLPRRRSDRFSGECLRPLVGGWDVDVDVEHVVGVVFGFEVLESVVLRAVRASHSGFLMFGHEVHVAADADGVLDEG